MHDITPCLWFDTEAQDAAEFGQEADGMILVMESSGTSPQVALKAKHDVEARGIPLLGIILNQSSDPLPNFLRRLLR